MKHKRCDFKSYYILEYFSISWPLQLLAFIFQIFSKAKVMFSIGGQYYNGRTISFSYMPDRSLENARNVTIHLHNRIGRFIKMRLYFASAWIMLSEVIFESGKCYRYSYRNCYRTRNRVLAWKDGKYSKETSGVVYWLVNNIQISPWKRSKYSHPVHRHPCYDTKASHSRVHVKKFLYAYVDAKIYCSWRY